MVTEVTERGSLRAGTVPIRVSPVVAAVVVWTILILASVIWGAVLVGDDPRIRLGAAPLFGRWDLLPSSAPRLVLPLVVAAVTISSRNRWTGARWTPLLIWSALIAAAWGITLALASPAGLIGGLDAPHDYLAALDGAPAAGRFLADFVEVLPTQPIHVQGHPPGFVLLLMGLRAISLGGATPVVALVIGAAASIPAAVAITVREVAGEAPARRALPFLVLTPAAVWLVSSADAVFAAAGAWSITLFVCATSRGGRTRDVLAVCSGLLGGAAVHLSYGLAPLAGMVAILAWQRRATRVALLAAAGGLVVTATFVLGGFWWPDGLEATVERYRAGVSRFRPYSYLLVANLAAAAVATGPAVAAGLARLRGRLWILLGPLVAALLLADLSGLSKGEVERIWLPFLVWLPVAGAALKGRRATWLALSAGWAMLIQSVVLTPW